LNAPAPLRLPAGEDRFGEHRGLGISTIAFTPAGRMAVFFRHVTRADAMPPQDPALWSAHGMTLLGPPLALDDGSPAA
jgi:hypothetical protein